MRDGKAPVASSKRRPNTDRFAAVAYGVNRRGGVTLPGLAMSLLTGIIRYAGTFRVKE